MDHEVEIVGPVIGQRIFPSYSSEFRYKAVPVGSERLDKFIRAMPQLVRQITGEVIYAFKPRVSSLGVAIIARAAKHKPIVLDIEDWEAGHFFSSGLKERVRAVRRGHSVLGDLHSAYMEYVALSIHRKTVVSRFLQNRFGGQLLPHGADCARFDPAKFSGTEMRSSLGIPPSTKIILFAGTARPHKGLDILVEALRSLSNRSLKLHVVGPLTRYLRTLMESAKDYVVYLGEAPHAMMPNYLAMADCVILPQTADPIAQAQIPGKVFEAMAMARPIIASDVSDMSEVLHDCGLLVPANDPQSLANAIHQLTSDSTLADEMGHKARNKCIREYSWAAMRKILLQIFPAPKEHTHI